MTQDEPNTDGCSIKGQAQHPLPIIKQMINNKFNHFIEGKRIASLLDEFILSQKNEINVDKCHYSQEKTEEKS